MYFTQRTQKNRKKRKELKLHILRELPLRSLPVRRNTMEGGPEHYSLCFSFNCK